MALDIHYLDALDAKRGHNIGGDIAQNVLAPTYASGIDGMHETLAVAFALMVAATKTDDADGVEQAFDSFLDALGAEKARLLLPPPR